MAPRDQELVDTHTGSPHYLALVAIITLSGLLYVLNLFPAYDPSVLAAPPLITFLAYFIGLVGGVIILSAWAFGIFMDKILGLLTQSIGLVLQMTGAGMMVCVLVPQGDKATFLAPFMLLIVISHSIQLYKVQRELKRVPGKLSTMKLVNERTE